MSEAIIAKGARYVGSSSLKPSIMTEIYTSSTMWLVPSDAVNNEFSVRIFGGGGGGSSKGGGGGGWMNNALLTLQPSELVYINIGIGGQEEAAGAYAGMQYPWYATSGGTTSFGTYLSANGGEPGDTYNNNGGNGGSGGGGYKYGGTGYQFGGGGGEECGGNGGQNLYLAFL